MDATNAKGSSVPYYTEVAEMARSLMGRTVQRVDVQVDTIPGISWVDRVVLRLDDGRQVVFSMYLADYDMPAVDCYDVQKQDG